MGSCVRASLLAVALLSAAPSLAAERVDLELVLAVDVSRSVDYLEGKLQREGYISAFSNPVLLAAIKSGYHGRIAVTYVEWSSRGMTRIVAPWTLIADAKDADAFNRILRTEYIGYGDRTSLSGVIDLAVSMFPVNAFDGDRRVIDISGDGYNNAGGLITYSRDEAVLRGITINGLPIINSNGGPQQTVLDLDDYFRGCVIGGPGAFIVVAEGFDTFAEAITRKLILEIADVGPEGSRKENLPIGVERFTRAQFLPRGAPQGAQMATPYAPGCDIGERRQGGPPLPPPFQDFQFR
jgi:hypothetical protein